MINKKNKQKGIDFPFGVLAAELRPVGIQLAKKYLVVKEKKKNYVLKMTRRRNNIVMIKRNTPKEVRLPDGRVFYGKYKRVDQNSLSANIWIPRTYRGNPTTGRQPRARGRAKPAHQIRGQGLKSANEKLINFAKKASKNLIFHELDKMGAKELPKVYSK